MLFGGVKQIQPFWTISGEVFYIRIEGRKAVEVENLYVARFELGLDLGMSLGRYVPN